MAATELATMPAAGTWVLDPAHTRIGFVARHLMVTKVRGEFKQINATVVVGDPVESSTIEADIDIASLTTGDAKRDAHLLSADFFDVEKFPKMTFKATAIKQQGPDHVFVNGELTIRGVTKPVELDVEYLGQVATPWGHNRFGVSASTKINREDWGLTWNVALEQGGVLVSKEILIEIETELSPQS